MALPKQAIDISFAQGLDQKTDPFRVQLGKFLKLQNSVFQKGGQLTKRNGYGILSSILNQSNTSSPSLVSSPDNMYNYLTTLNNNLTAIGPTISAYNEGNKTWVNKGTITPLTLNTSSLIKNNLNQTQCDAAIGPNGLICTVYSELNNITTSYKYAIADSVTGQNIIAPINILNATSTPRVFLVGDYFVLVFLVNTALTYFAISAYNPTSSTAQAALTSDAVIATPSMAWDCLTINDSLYFAYYTATGGAAVNVSYIPLANIILAGASITPLKLAGEVGAAFSLCYDPSIQSLYVSYSMISGGNYTLKSYQVPVTLATKFIWVNRSQSTLVILNTVSAAQNNTFSVFIEVGGTGIQPIIKSYYVAGVTTTATQTLVGTGLASKAFIYNNNIYFWVSWQSTYQNTYFLINGSLTVSTAPVVCAKLAYENGGGYLTTGLPTAQLIENTVSIPYLRKDFIEALNTLNNPQQTTSGGIYSQTGINLASIQFTNSTIDTAEIANSLHLSGGFLGMYDGYLPVEHNFFLWPELPVSAVAYNPNSAITPTGTAANGSTAITISSGIVYPGMTISDTTNPTYIPAGTTVVSVNGGVNLIISNPTTHAISGDTLAIQGNIAAKPDGSTNTDAYFYQVLYSWTDDNGNIYRSAPSIPVPVTTSGSDTDGVVTLQIPALNLTMKTANPVKICVYRWSVANQIYYEVTSITAPLLNDPSTGIITFADTQPDANIVGNDIIYTNGGVIEDVNAPASNILTLFDTRLWLVDAEDQNLLWYSKQVIEATPVEMSDLFTLYIAPNTGTASSTGPITALAPMDDKLIIFKKDAIYYINGIGPDNTGANSQYSQPIFITSTVGCNNQQSVVLTPDGLMFQSDKGIWLLNRSLQSSYIGAPVESFNSSMINSAVNVPATNQIRFTLNTGQTLMYDYYYQQWGTFVGVPAVSSCIYQGLHTFINEYGQVYQETPNMYLDGSNPVLLSFTTGWLNLAGLQGYERAYYFYLLGTYYSPHKLNLQIAYDYNSSPSQNSLVMPDNFSSSVPSSYGDQPAPFGSPINIEQWRVFLDTQKCQALQISLNEVFDPTFNTVAGAGLTLSGINLVIASKKGYRPIRAANSIGGSGQSQS